MKTYTEQEVVELFEKFEKDRSRYYAKDDNNLYINCHY